MVKKSKKSPKKLFQEIAVRYGLDLLLLFGSRAEGGVYVRKDSDFDVAYSSKKSLSLKKESQLIVDLAEILKNENIDLVNIRRASPLLLYAITNKANKILFARERIIFDELRAYAFKIFIESQPLYELKKQRILENIK